MKLIFLSLAVFIYGYFCDICLAICDKMVKTALKRGKALCGKSLVFLSNFTNNNMCRWQSIEKRLITLLVLKRSS